jgi:hypothetical protein
MKILFSLLIALTLSGCYQTTNLRDIKDASAICGGLDAVVEISANWVGNETVTCSNRATYWISHESLNTIKEKTK